MQEPSVFTKIINGEIPAQKIYEDDKVIAILDIQPMNPGHALVIPKVQIDSLWDLDDDLYSHLMEVVKKVAARQQKILSPKRIGIAVEGFGVAHAHIHVFPLYEGLEATITKHANRDDKTVHTDELDEMAKKLYFS